MCWLGLSERSSPEGGWLAMPMYSAFQIPPPKNWQDFECLCWDLWRRIWNDPNTQRNGRTGQSQCGVDVSGQCGGWWCGVQAKGKDNFTNQRVTVDELAAEVRKARRFQPALRNFILATTGPKDAVVEQAARELTENHRTQGKFSVAVMGWDDILLLLDDHPDVIEKYYPWVRSAQNGWMTTQSSAVSSYGFPFPVPVQGNHVDTAVLDRLFERVQQIIGLAYWVTATTTPFDDFTYLLSFEPTDLPLAGYKVFRIEIHCHLTTFVSLFQMKCQRELEGRDVEVSAELNRAPDDLELTMNAIGGRLVPYRISRRGERSIWIRELISQPNQSPGWDTTSGLLVLMHGVLNNKTLIWDDFAWSAEAKKAMQLLVRVGDTHAFSWDQIRLERSAPERWSLLGTESETNGPVGSSDCEWP